MALLNELFTLYRSAVSRLGVAVQISACVHGGLGCHRWRRGSPTISPRLSATVPHRVHLSGPHSAPLDTPAREVTRPCTFADLLYCT